MENIYNIQKTFYKISDFVSWKKRDNLILSPYFQRRSVWKKGAKSYLMDTILKNLPIPIIFLRDLGTDPKTLEPKRQVIDGQQRLRTVFSFIDKTLLKDYNVKRDDFTIQKNHNADYAGKEFQFLEPDVKSAILNYEFSVHILPSSIDDREVIQIFRRMNSTNYVLNKQELLNACYFGEFKSTMYKVSALHINKWRAWETFSEDDIARMFEAELTSELAIAMINSKIEGKSNTMISSFYKTYDDNFKFKTEFEKRFNEVMELIDKTFAYSKRDFVFFKRTLFYSFFCHVYNITFGFETPLSKKASIKQLNTEQINNILEKNNKIAKRKAPRKVLESSDRRTTSIQERKNIYNYLEPR